jgi:hypothetical protein
LANAEIVRIEKNIKTKNFFMMVYKAIIRLKNNEKRCLLLVEYVKNYNLL